MWEMIGGSLSESERFEARNKTREIGTWLRGGEPSQSVEEDLLAHRMRSLLVKLSDAVGDSNRRRARRLLLAIQGCVAVMFELRAER